MGVHVSYFSFSFPSVFSPFFFHFPKAKKLSCKPWGGGILFGMLLRSRVPRTRHSRLWRASEEEAARGTRTHTTYLSLSCKIENARGGGKNNTYPNLPDIWVPRLVPRSRSSFSTAPSPSPTFSRTALDLSSHLVVKSTLYPRNHRIASSAESWGRGGRNERKGLVYTPL